MLLGCGLSSAGSAGGELLGDELADDLRVGLALGELHHLAHEEAGGGLFAGLEVGDGAGIGGDGLVHERLEGGGGVEGGTVDQQRTFYTCLYRALLFPRRFFEIGADGAAIHRSPTTGEVRPGVYFCDTGF